MSTDLSKLNRGDLTSFFNKRIFALLKICKTHVKDSSSIERLVALLKVAKRIDHEILITSAGPYLWKYQKLIADRNIEAFSPKHMEQEVASVKVDKSESKSKQMALDLFTSIYEAADAMKAAEGDVIYKAADELVDAYLEFCIRCKTEMKK